MIFINIKIYKEEGSGGSGDILTIHDKVVSIVLHIVFSGTAATALINP